MTLRLPTIYPLALCLVSHLSPWRQGRWLRWPRSPDAGSGHDSTPSTGDLRKNDLENPQVVSAGSTAVTSAKEMGSNTAISSPRLTGLKCNRWRKCAKSSSYQPGDEVRVEGLRNGEPIESDGFLGGWPENIPS